MTRETPEQRVERVERVAAALRARLSVCRRRRDEEVARHRAEIERLRAARDGFKQERDRLRTHFDLTAEAGSHGRYSACYLLLKLGVPLYVGQSVNVFGRVAYHRGVNSWPTKGDFDEVRIIWCARDELDNTELRLIEELRPPMNSAGVLRPYMRAGARRRLPEDLFGPVFLALEQRA